MVPLTHIYSIQRPFGFPLSKRQRDFKFNKRSLKPLVPRVSEDQETDSQLR